MSLIRLNHRCLSIPIITLMITFVSCNDDKDEIEVLIPTEDELIIHKIEAMGREANLLWDGFDYIQTEQAYFILTDDDGNNPRGYLLNPSLPLPVGSIKLTNMQSAGMNLYRNDGLLTDALNSLNGSIWQFSSFSVNELPCFLIRQRPKPTYTFYDFFKDGSGDTWLPLVMVHEMFHLFQINEWTMGAPLYDGSEFPLTNEVLTHQLALYSLMEEAHKITTPDAARKALTEYAVLIKAMAAVDPPLENVILSVSSANAFIEGSARYVEHFSALKTSYVTINDDPSHGWHQYISSATTSTQVKLAFAARIWYHVGSASIHLLALNEVNVFDQMQDGKTQYEIAVNFLNLTDEQYQTTLNEIMSRPSWSEYQEQAEYLTSLD
jgi:hypothetical protein